MAITAPTEFSHTMYGYTNIGGTTGFKWNKGTGDIEWYLIILRNMGVDYIQGANPIDVQKYYFLPSETSAIITTPSSYNIGDILNFHIAAGRGDKNNPSEYSENDRITLVVTIREDTPETPTPPITAAAGRLEQFQNDAGEQIFPRTIIEGIFRQSDSKPLSELLSGIELPLSIADGGTGADSAGIALGNLVDGAVPSTERPLSNYVDMYIPVNVNGICYKIPFNEIQKWTVGDRGNSVFQENTMYSSFIARGIAAGTTDYAAGSTAMTSGTIYLVYE